MFNKLVNSYLEEMGFEPNQFYQKISALYPVKQYLFESLIEKFYCQNNLKVQDFNHFSNKNNLEDNTVLFNALYELFNNISQYHNGEKLGLFKEREAAWGLPTNVLNKYDINDSGDLADLPNVVKVFRGMSLEEFKNDDFGQSWTTDYETARKFAEETYIDKPKGIVVKAMLAKNLVLHYEKSKEFEVIIIKGSIKKSDVSISS